MKRVAFMICLLGFFLTMATIAVRSQAPPGTSVDRVGFPDGYQTNFTHLYTVDRPDSGQIRAIWGNDKAASVKPGESFPYGSVILFESWRSKRDSQNNILLDENGRFIKDTLTTIFVSRKEPGFGVEYQQNRNGEWEHIAYRPDKSVSTTPQNSGACAVCHLQAAPTDYVFRVRNFNRASGAVAKGVMQQFLFLPRIIRVTTGATVSWYNVDEEAHRIRATDGTWESNTMPYGAGFDLTFKHPGIYNYNCTIHPAMRGTVVVETPLLSISNLTSSSRGTSFRAGDTWKLEVTNAAPLTSVFLRILKDGQELGISGPYGATTDSSGRWSMTGTVTAAHVGGWQEQVIIGSNSGSTERSEGTISFTVAN